MKVIVVVVVAALFLKVAVLKITHAAVFMSFVDILEMNA